MRRFFSFRAVIVWMGASLMAVPLSAQDEYANPVSTWQYQEQPAASAPSADMQSAAPSADQLPAVPEDPKAAAAERKKKQAELAKKVSSAHKPLFFENDFSYLCDPDYCGREIGDKLKLRCLPGGIKYSIGGQYRGRAHFEQNMRGLGLTGVDDSFFLRRTRLYGDFQLTSNIRLYAEMLDAVSEFEDFGPRPIEENRADMQNLFVDARIWTGRRGSWTARIGRQELLYGAQRAVSPLDWANTRRTFEGARVMWQSKSKKLSIDGFWTHPMRINVKRFDSPNLDQEFMGLYSSYKGRKDQTIDGYFLRLLNGSGANDFKYNTVGVRWQGSKSEYLWDVEAAAQFGDNTDGSDHAAGMATLGLGRKFSKVRWTPTVWAYYDWASGDDATGAGNGFHHHFPLAHKYLGFMDLFGRRNIEDLNLLVTMQPARKLKLLAWYHYMFLETQTDTPYSVVMTPFNPGNLPGSPDLGQEIDLLATWTFDARHQLGLGYSHFFAGDYYQTTAGVPYNGDADFYYTQWTVNF